jgi:hypothetical protein
LSDGQFITEATVASVANKVTYGAAGTAFWGGMTANEFAAYGGVLIAVIGLIVQWYYKRKESRMRSEEHGARMAMLSRGIDPDGE